MGAADKAIYNDPSRHFFGASEEDEAAVTAALQEMLDQLKAEARRINELNERASETIANTIEGIREVLAE